MMFFSPFFSQLEMYSKKFDEFQGTVSKSNTVYSSFKQDMDKVRTVSQSIWYRFDYFVDLQKQRKL